MSNLHIPLQHNKWTRGQTEQKTVKYSIMKGNIANCTNNIGLTLMQKFPLPWVLNGFTSKLHKLHIQLLTLEQVDAYEMKAIKGQ
jgi:hypothetical protein